MTPTIEDAVILAARAHRGQRDKAGEPYILHALRVMLSLHDPAERMVAVLHDLLEDTGVSPATLREAGYGEDLIASLETLTRRPDESYEDFIERIAGNPIARRVKLADLADNMDMSRLASPGEADRRRIARYEAARARLG